MNGSSPRIWAVLLALGIAPSVLAVDPAQGNQNRDQPPPREFGAAKPETGEAVPGARTPRAGRPIQPEDQSGGDAAGDGGLGGGRLVLPRPGGSVRPGRGQWKLGVHVQYSDVGGRIDRVLPNSPAAKAGLETRDTIVNIGGEQIGFVNGWVYPLDEAIQRQVGASGWIVLLVQDWRSRELMAIPVRLERWR